ncbi:MAG: BatA and WFA domain-containing protein [Phycisphaerales bacterium]
MTWLTPVAGLVVAGITLPLLLALYFLRLRRRKRLAPSTMLWRRAVEDLRANAPFQRLRPSWLLFLQILVLALIALAIMQPRMDLGAVRGSRVVLLVDHSASMNTKDGPGGTTRLEEARKLARERARRLMSGGLFSGAPSEVMVVAFGDRAEIRSPFTTSLDGVLRAIDGVEPTDTATRIGDALSLARAFSTDTDPDRPDAAPRGSAQLELFSDGRIADLEEQSLRGDEPLRYVQVGKADTGNCGFEALAADRSVERPADVEVFAAVRNTGTEAASSLVELTIDGTIRGATPQPVQVPPSKAGTGGTFEPGSTRFTFTPFAQPRGGVIGLRWLETDAYPVDDIAWLVSAPAKKLRVAIVGDQPALVRAVLEGMPLAELKAFTCAEYDAAVAAGAGAIAVDVTVIVGCWPAAPVPGRYLAFGLPRPGTVAEFNPFAEKSGVLVRSTQREHPIFRAASLDELVVSRFQATAPGADALVLAEAAEGPVVSFVQKGGMQALVLPFDPLDSNWPFQRSFVNFIANSVEWLGSLAEAAAGGTLSPGDVIATTLPAGVREATVRHPDGSSESVAVPDPSQFSWGPIRRAGVYRVEWKSGGQTQERAFAVNMLDPVEARVAARETLQIGTERIQARRGGGVLTDLWPWAIGAGLLLLAAEWWVYHRRHWM